MPSWVRLVLSTIACLLNLIAIEDGSVYAHPNHNLDYEVHESTVYEKDDVDHQRRRMYTRDPVRKVSAQPKHSATSYDLPTLIKCPVEIEQAYRAPPKLPKGSMGKEWCEMKKRTAGIILGKSWGTLTRQEQKIWDTSKCNEWIKLSKIQTCNQRFGWEFFKRWRAVNTKIIEPASTRAKNDSNVACIEELKTSTLCRMENVEIDYSRMKTGLSMRNFKPGFVQTFGKMVYKNFQEKKNFPPFEILGKLHRSGERAIHDTKEHMCDIIESRPTFIMSNDDIYNIGHYFNDIMAVWASSVLAGVDTRHSVLINIDGVRAKGPGGGIPHKLMNNSNPDEHGPYRAYYDSWFQEQLRGIELQKKKICYRELYFQSLPGIAWFWGDWGQETQCSKQAASPLYQSFSLFLRRRWIEEFGQNSLPSPSIKADIVHIVIELRSINKNKKILKESTSRHIKNHIELKNALEKLPNVRITVQDFALLPFPEQVALSHSAGVFVSMHGAGTTHIFHMAVGKPNCCGLVELFPDTSIEFHAAHGYSNLARHLGLHHTRYISPEGSTTKDGTDVEIDAVVDRVRRIADRVRSKPSCLHDVRDTRNPNEANALNTEEEWLQWN